MIAPRVVQTILGAALIASCFYHGLALFGALRWRRSSGRQAADFTPPVSILKPLRGADPEQQASFETFCALDYPAYQLVFGARDPADPGLEAARRLQPSVPGCELAFVSGEGGAGLNRKVANLRHMLSSARHDVLVLCDSDMRVEPDYLRRVVAPLADPKVGLVTCLYRGYAPAGMASALEAVGIGADFAPSVLAAKALEGMSFALGSTIAVRRSALEDAGGFEAVADALADDYLLGNRVKQAGYEVVLSDYVIDDVLGREAFGAMWSRRLRWARTMRVMRPVGWAGAGVTHTLVIGAAFAGALGFRAAGLACFGAALAWRAFVALSVSLRCTRDPNVLRFLPLLPVSDALAFGLWVSSFLGAHVAWRGERFRVRRDGTLAQDR